MQSYTFSHAITRKPATSIIAGLRAVDTGTPDLGVMQAHHTDYIAALRATGAEVIELAALEAFPDSVFVEDTALCLPKGAVVMRPGAPSRKLASAASSRRIGRSSRVALKRAVSRLPPTKLERSVYTSV